MHFQNVPSVSMCVAPCGIMLPPANCQWSRLAWGMVPISSLGMGSWVWWQCVMPVVHMSHPVRFACSQTPGDVQVFVQTPRFVCQWAASVRLQVFCHIPFWFLGNTWFGMHAAANPQSRNSKVHRKWFCLGCKFQRRVFLVPPISLSWGFLVRCCHRPK